MPKEYAYVIEELITEKPEVLNKEAYYESIINTTVELGTAEEFIVVLSELIQRLAVDHVQITISDTVSDNSCNTCRIPCGCPHPDNMESDLIKKMHKAIAIIRFKLEGQLIKKWPEYGMKERLLLEHIDYEQGTIEIEGRTYKLLDTS